MTFSATLVFDLLWATTIFAVPHDADFLPKASPIKIENISKESSAQPISLPRADLLFPVGVLNTMLGINYKGKWLCNGWRPPNIKHIQTLMNVVPDGDEYYNAQMIVCRLCDQCPHLWCLWPQNAAICAYPQRMKKYETLSGAKAKTLVQKLIDNDCQRCGSAPIHDGNNVDDGELTIDYVVDRCEESLCHH